MLLASTLVALALAAGPDAGAQASTAEAKPAAAAKPKAKRVCYDSTVSGSRLSRKTCVTVAPSKAEREAAREEAEAGKDAAAAQPAA